MPTEKMQIDTKRKTSAKVNSGVLATMTSAMWLTPVVPFKPTPKSQSGEFGRTLPKFNAAQLKNRFPEKFFIGARSPYALVNAKRMKKKGVMAIDWNVDRPAEEVKELFRQYLGNVYEQLFDPQYNLTLFSGRGSALNGGGTGDSSGICTDATNWVPSTLPWTVGAYPTFDAPIQGGADDCWFIAALSSIAWTFPDILTADNSCGIFILDPAGPLSGQELVDDGYIYPSDDLPVRVRLPPHSFGHIPNIRNAWLR